MTQLAASEGSSEPLQHAGPVRRTIHFVIALAGWVLFAYWWWLVMQRTGREQIVWTLAFIGISLFVIVLVTALWVVHNVRIFRRKGPRLNAGVRPAAERKGSRTLAAVPRRSDVDIMSAPIVRVVVDGGKKAYRPGASNSSRAVEDRRGAGGDLS